MKLHLDNVINFVLQNWVPVAAFVGFIIGAVIWVDGRNSYEAQTTTVLKRVDKNVGTITKVLLKEGVISPSDVELTTLP